MHDYAPNLNPARVHLMGSASQRLETAGVPPLQGGHGTPRWPLALGRARVITFQRDGM